MRIKMGMMALAFTAMGYGCDDGGDGAGGGDPIGAACTVGTASCASGFCFPDQTQPYCTDECTPGSCPSGFECSPNAQPNVCVRTSGGPEPEANPEPSANPEPGPEGNPEPSANPEPEGGTDLDCAGINECLSACGEGDMACFNGCIESGTPAAQDEFIAIIDCINENGGDQEACQAEIEQCLGSQPQGDGECPDFYSCAGNCPDNDQDCVQGCFNGLAGDAQNLVLDVVNCVGPVVDANPDATDEELNDLINDQCAAEIEACFGEPAPPGDDSCGEVVMCVDAVISQEGTQEEVQACFNEGTEAARAAYGTLVDCIVDADCMNFNCPACQAELDACNGGGNPEPEPMPEAQPEPMPEPMPEAPEPAPQPAPEPEN